MARGGLRIKHGQSLSILDQSEMRDRLVLSQSGKQLGLRCQNRMDKLRLRVGRIPEHFREHIHVTIQISDGITTAPDASLRCYYRRIVCQCVQQVAERFLGVVENLQIERQQSHFCFLAATFDDSIAAFAEVMRAAEEHMTPQVSLNRHIHFTVVIKATTCCERTVEIGLGQIKMERDAEAVKVQSLFAVRIV